MLRETHAASDRKRNRTAGLQGGGELRPKNDLQASRHMVFRAGAGRLHPKTRLRFAVRPRGN